MNATIARDCTRTDSYELPRLHRKGQWVCRVEGLRLFNSLEIWVHLHLLKSDSLPLLACSHTICGKQDIAFDCDEHGWEEA